MLTLDGSRGEGGGQILRSSLALSLVTRTPFAIEKIRAGRKKPGLMRQHLAAVRAAAEVGRAEISGAEIGSQSLSFRPGPVSPGDYHFAIGTAGSATLVMQTVLPALLSAGGPSALLLEGGTYNPMAPPFDFLEKAFLPLLRRMGPAVEAVLERPGFYPAGAGRVRAKISPAGRLLPLTLNERGEVRRRLAVAKIAELPFHIADRELAAVEAKLGWERACLRGERLKGAACPGNVVVIEVESENVCEVFCGFGEKGVRAEAVAEAAAAEAAEYLAAEVPVGKHLADQLLLPMALAGKGAFRTLAPTPHTTTHVEVIQRFLDVKIRVEPISEQVYQIEVG
jgi:RNA 3'-terminal phosphate cyclase (ATP)